MVSTVDHAIHVECCVTIERSPEDLYRFWRGLENLPRFMRHLREVRVLEGVRSHWIARGPLHRQVEWEAEIVEDEPNRLISWRSVGDAEVSNSGCVRFEPAGEYGTQVRVSMYYRPPGGRLGAVVAGLTGEKPAQQVRDDLRRFKQIMEAGEIATIEGQPRGTCGR